MSIAGIQKTMGFHSSRHTFAMICLNMGMPIEVVQKLLGHSELKTTKIYAQIEEETTFREMGKWGEI